MITISDEEYLSRPILPNLIIDVSNNTIHVECKYTIFCSIQRITNISNKDILLGLYNDVYKLAKNKGISISYNRGYKKLIKNNYEDYTAEIELYNNLFELCRNKFKGVGIRGIHQGYKDDRVLMEALEYSNLYSKIFYRDSLYSKMKYANNELVKLYNKLLYSERCSKIIKIYL